MKNTHIALLLILLTTAIIFLGYPVLADEDEIVETGDEVEVDGFIYEIQEDNTVTLTDYQSDVLSSLTIPGTITYNQQTYTVTSIEEHTFSGCDTLTEVKIEENIISIGDYAFSECESLQQIHFPSTLKDLGGGILSGSNNAAVTIAAGNYALCYEEGLLTQNDILLYVSPSLEEIVLPDTIHSIAAYAFQNCNDLERITIPQTIEKIEEQAFYQCYGIHSIAMENNPSIVIENNAFADMEETGTIYVPTQEMKQHIEANPQSYPEGVQVTQIIPYEISYNTGGGTFKETCITKADNTKPVLLPDVEKEGYEFLGWCSDEACQQEPVYQIEEGQSDNVTLYAKWEAVDEQLQPEQDTDEQAEEAIEYSEIASNVYKLLEQKKSRQEASEKEDNKAAINAVRESELATEAQQVYQDTEEEDEKAQQQIVKINEEASGQKTEAAKTTQVAEKPVQADQQATQGEHKADSIAAKLLLAFGIIFMLAGGTYEFTRHIARRRESNTNEKLQAKNFKDTDSK